MNGGESIIIPRLNPKTQNQSVKIAEAPKRNNGPIAIKGRKGTKKTSHFRGYTFRVANDAVSKS